ncbi:MAG: NADH-quinone oxidoreductase subunit J [Pirellula sp.]
MNPLAIDPKNLPLVSGDEFQGNLSQILLLVILLGTAAYLLLQHGLVKSKMMAACGAALLAVAALMAFMAIPMQLESVVRMCFSILAVAGGMAFITAREPVHAALGFATAVLSSCGVMFMQSAYFIAAATMIVYAGATIIIFLFVLMFAQKAKLQWYDVQLTHPMIAAGIATCLLFAIAWGVSESGEILPVKLDLTRPYSLSVPGSAPGESMPPVPDASMTKAQLAEFTPAKTSGLGRSMFTDYLLAIELAGTVLLVATIGAIVLAQKPERDPS